MGSTPLIPCARSSSTLPVARPGDHDFRRFDDRQRVVAAAQFQRAHSIGGDHGRQQLVPNSHANLGQQPIDPDFVER
jgi:hypothetical protein